MACGAGLGKGGNVRQREVGSLVMGGGGRGGSGEEGARCPAAGVGPP